jgi:spore maturation protein CgeB
MRILIIDTCYPAFLRSHYEAHPGLEQRPYAEQWRSVMDTFFGTADSYSHFLGELGHEAHEYVVNSDALQQAWAREHGLRRGRWSSLLRRGPEVETVMAQAEEFRPDVVYVQNLSALPVETLRRLRALAGLLVGQIASELPPTGQLAAFDVIATSFPHLVPRFEAMGIAGEYLRIGFDPRVLDRVATNGRREGAVFVGSLGRLQHDRGNAMLAEAAEQAPIDFWGRGYEEWPEGSPVRNRYHGEAWGLDMYEVIARASISLNRHIDVAEGHANNMRLYESTGVGAMLLTDAKADLGALFDVGVEVVAYDGAVDLASKVDHYLAHDDERTAIAEAGQRRTLAEHTYAHRMRDLVEILERHRS